MTQLPDIQTIAPIYPGTARLSICSAANGQRYCLDIAAPEGPVPTEGWALLVVLDGNALFGTFLETLRLRARITPGQAQVLLVGIGYETDEPFPKDDRFRDFTPPAAEETLLARSDGEPWPASGGASAFIRALIDEILPLLGDRHRIDPTRRTLFGYSLSGLLATQILRQQPEVFATYAIASPSLWWPGVEGLDRDAEGWADALEGAGRPRVHLGIGAQDSEEMCRHFDQFVATLSALPADRLDVTSAKVPFEDHVSVLPALVGRTVSLALSPHKRH